MAAAIEDVDYYALLEVSPEATEQEIRTAYRRKSLKVHPDRNPDNPEAATLFHDLRVASEVLLDPTQRASFDKLQAARHARKTRFASLDSKRKAMAEDLERRERDFKRGKSEEDVKANQRLAELNRLKEEGRRMREMKEKERNGQADRERDADIERVKEERRRTKQAAATRAGEANVVELGLMDTTLTLRWPKSRRAEVSDREAVMRLVRLLVAPDEDQIDVVLSADKIPKGRCNVKFRTLSAAVRLMDRSKVAQPSKLWDGLEVSWAGKKPPDVLGANGDSAPTEVSKANEKPAPSAPSFAASFPISTSIANDETDILARLRQKEREKLMDQMRLEDEAEEAK